MATKTNSVYYKDSSSRCPTASNRQWRTPTTCVRENARRQTSVSTPCKRRTTPGDRYVPSSGNDLDFTRFQVSTPTRTNPYPLENEVMRESLLALKGQSSEKRVLSFHQDQEAMPSAKYNYWNDYSTLPASATTGKKQHRIPKSAEKVLDAPNLINDFYLNLLDWSRQDMVCVALGSAVYVFHASQGAVNQLCELDSEYVTSVQWNRSGKYLAVGTSNAEVQLWDLKASKCIRKMRSHKSRVGSLSWRPKSSLLTCGSQSGQVHNYDPRMAQFKVQTLSAHTLDVCGLKWSSNGRFLASGGNDNVVHIWDTYSHDPWTAPRHSHKGHTAAVKALSWCPWQPNVLASGGGSADKSIHLWNAYNGESQGHMLTDSQVSGLVWSSEHRELLSSHGNTANSLRLWKWQENSSDTPMRELAEVQGHEGRILNMAASPDGQTVVTAGADETLRFWKCFESKKRSQKTSNKISSSDFNISKFVR